MAPRSTNLHVRARRLLVDGEDTQQPESVWTQNRTDLISRALHFEAQCNQLQIAVDDVHSRSVKFRRERDFMESAMQDAVGETANLCEVMTRQRILHWIDMLFLARSFETDPAPRMRIADHVLFQIAEVIASPLAQVGATLEFAYERELDAVVYVAARWSARYPRPDDAVQPFYERGGSRFQKEYENEDHHDPMRSMLDDTAVRLQFRGKNPNTDTAEKFDYDGYATYISE